MIERPRKDGGLHLGALLEELLGMLQLELEVMLVGIWAEPYLLKNHLGGIRLHLFCLLPLLVKELLVVEYLAHRRISLVADKHQVEFHLIRHGQGLGNWVNTLLGDILSDKAHLRSGDLLVYRGLVLVAFRLEMLIGLASLLETRWFRSVRSWHLG